MFREVIIATKNLQNHAHWLEQSDVLSLEAARTAKPEYIMRMQRSSTTVCALVTIVHIVVIYTQGSSWVGRQGCCSCAGLTSKRGGRPDWALLLRRMFVGVSLPTKIYVLQFPCREYTSP